MNHSFDSRGHIPAFTPVPARARKDGWLPQRQVDFIGVLAETGCVAEAARAVGMSRESAYRLRERPGAESFAAAWDAALASRPPGRLTTATDLLWHRMLYGTLRPVMRDGLYVAAVRAPDSHAVESLYRRVTRLQRSMKRRLRGEKSR
jgi:hypothetical protein